jgi:predicted transcriptional regulator
MDKTISIAEAARMLDITMPTVSYYIKQGRLRFELSDQRTAGRRRKRVVYLADVEKLQSELRPPDTVTNEAA